MHLARTLLYLDGATSTHRPHRPDLRFAPALRTTHPPPLDANMRKVL